MFEQVFKHIDDILWKEAGCTTELDYTEQSSWRLFLKYLDDLERDRQTIAKLEGRKYQYPDESTLRSERLAGVPQLYRGGSSRLTFPGVLPRSFLA